MSSYLKQASSSIFHSNKSLCLKHFLKQTNSNIFLLTYPTIIKKNYLNSIFCVPVLKVSLMITFSPVSLRKNETKKYSINPLKKRSKM